jgi:hypothetical protein
MDYHWEIGSLKLWIRRTEIEWLVAYEHQPGDLYADKQVVAEKGQKPEDLVWNRFVYEDPSCIMQLMPALHDRAVVISSETPIRMLPGNSALFFVSIPIWVRIYAGESKKAMLIEVPTITLSNTWFGDPMNGELCYSLSTHARRNVEDLEASPQRAVCPLHVRNNWTEQLDFQMMAVHVEHLKIFKGPDQLWTNEVYINFLNKDQLSQVNFSENEPSVIQGCELMAEERVPFDKSILKKSIGFLRSFTNF